MRTNRAKRSILDNECHGGDLSHITMYRVIRCATYCILYDLFHFVTLRRTIVIEYYHGILNIFVFHGS